MITAGLGFSIKPVELKSVFFPFCMCVMCMYVTYLHVDMHRFVYMHACVCTCVQRPSRDFSAFQLLLSYWTESGSLGWNQSPLACLVLEAAYAIDPLSLCPSAGITGSCHARQALLWALGIHCAVSPDQASVFLRNRLATQRSKNILTSF